MAVGYIKRAAEEREALRQRARELRADGLLYREIAEQLEMSEANARILADDYARERDRTQRNGHRSVDRPCAYPNCHVVIPASAKADREYCSRPCQYRTKYLRKIGAM